MIATGLGAEPGVHRTATVLGRGDLNPARCGSGSLRVGTRLPPAALATIDRLCPNGHT